MDRAKVVDKMNQAISLELGALLQYNQYANVLLGQERQIWEDWFRDTADEALKHARKFAAKVVALGGVPSVEPEPIKQTNDLTQMLENSLTLEKRAVGIYTEALALCEGNAAYCNLLEDQIEDETDDVEEIEKFLRKISPVEGKSAAKKAG